MVVATMKGKAITKLMKNHIQAAPSLLKSCFLSHDDESFLISQNDEVENATPIPLRSSQ